MKCMAQRKGRAVRLNPAHAYDYLHRMPPMSGSTDGYETGMGTQKRLRLRVPRRKPYVHNNGTGADLAGRTTGFPSEPRSPARGEGASEEQTAGCNGRPNRSSGNTESLIRHESGPGNDTLQPDLQQHHDRGDRIRVRAASGTRMVSQACRRTSEIPVVLMTRAREEMRCSSNGHWSSKPLAWASRSVRSTFGLAE